MLTVVFFTPLWRRPGIMTDVEFAELRNAGRPAAILRGCRPTHDVVEERAPFPVCVCVAIAIGVLRLNLRH